MVGSGGEKALSWWVSQMINRQLQPKVIKLMSWRACVFDQTSNSNVSLTHHLSPCLSLSLLNQSLSKIGITLPLSLILYRSTIITGATTSWPPPKSRLRNTTTSTCIIHPAMYSNQSYIVYAHPNHYNQAKSNSNQLYTHQESKRQKTFALTLIRRGREVGSTLITHLPMNKDFYPLSLTTLLPPRQPHTYTPHVS